MLYCNSAKLFSHKQYIKSKQTQKIKNISNLAVQYLQESSSTVQQLALSERARRATARRREGGGRQSHRVIRIRRRRVSCGGHSCLTHMAFDGTGAGSLLNSVLSTVLKKLPSDVWVVVPFLVTGDTAALDCI